MLTCTHPSQQTLRQRFLTNWRKPTNHLPALVSVDMAWTILLNELRIPRKPVDQVTYHHYHMLYAKQIVAMFRQYPN